jgi:hypothetical protein
VAKLNRTLNFADLNGFARGGRSQQLDYFPPNRETDAAHERPGKANYSDLRCVLVVTQANRGRIAAM